LKRTAAIHITPTCIRVAEGAITGSKLRIYKTALVPNAEQYFPDGKCDHLAELAAAVAAAMRSAGMKAKDLCIAYENLGDIAVEWVEGTVPEEKPRRKISNLWHMEIGKKAITSQKEQETADTGMCRQVDHWGVYVTEGERGTLRSVSTADNDLIAGIAYEFHDLGYHVNSIESQQTALLYLRHAAPYSWDSKEKMLIQTRENACTVYRWTKDTPAHVTERPFDTESSTVPEQVLAICQRESLAGNLRRPLIMLGGDLMATYSAYIGAVEYMEQNGCTILDIYNCKEPDGGEPNRCVDKALPTEIYANRGKENVCGQFTVCIGLLYRQLEKEPCNLLTKGNLQKTDMAALKLSARLVSISAAALALALALTGVRLVGTYRMRSELQSATALQGSLASAIANRQGMEDRLTALAGIDSRYKSVLVYALGNVNSSLNIASIDTENVLEETTSASKFAADTASQPAETGTDGSQTPATEAGGTPLDLTSRQKIIIRGYATSSGDAMQFYNSLMASGIGSVELVGIQQVKLEDNRKAQNGEKISTAPVASIYAFELSVGGEK